MTDSTDVPSGNIEESDSTSLFSLLKNRDEETFIQRCAKTHRERLDMHDGEYTHLQWACLYGLPRAVEALLINGADPNGTAYPDQNTPIMLAGQLGYYNIVEILAGREDVICKNTAQGTVLHAVLEGMSTAQTMDGSSFAIEKYINCIKLLLEKRSNNLLDINAQNEDGFTALHLAAKLGEKSIILLLLEHGAYIGLRCSHGYTPISLMNANVFKEYLDNSITTNGKLPIDKNYEIFYNHDFLIPPRIDHDEPKIGQGNHAPISETEPLIEFSRFPEFRSLLKHPVLANFLCVKWYTIRKYFWINFTFYLTFWLCLTLHTLALHSSYNKEGRKEPYYFVAWWTWCPSIVLCSLVGLRELFKFFISPVQYIFDMENVLHMALLILNLLVLSGKLGAEVAAVAVLLTWTKMVFVINHHPSLSSNLKLCKVVCTSFVKLLACWAMLLFAFALSFHLLFKDPNSTSQKYNSIENNCTGKNGDDPNYFEHIITSFFKVIPMMTGEFDISSLPLNCHPVVSHVIFILFVFLIPIILFNLMNGLVVNDAQDIRNDAEIVRYETLVRQIAFIENMAIYLETLYPYSFISSRLTLDCRRQTASSEGGQTAEESSPVRMRRALSLKPDKVKMKHGRAFFSANVDISEEESRSPESSSDEDESSIISEPIIGPKSFYSIKPGYDKNTCSLIVSGIMNETNKILEARKRNLESIQKH